mmetsp:Transcript_9581/g.25886  ORF Transcript_9581/g.25886 Transcript_9581/m.25886 type:complete len:148 (+) Transcript_9581:113-556(+)
MLTSLHFSAGSFPTSSVLPHSRCNATRSSRSCSKLVQAMGQPERTRVVTEAEGHASTQADPQLQGSPRALRRQNVMRRRQAELSPPPPPQQQQQQLPQGEQGNMDSVQQPQLQTSRRIPAGQQEQQQQQQQPPNPHQAPWQPDPCAR